MGRFDYEKNGTRWGGPGGAKGHRASPKTQFKRTCSNCGGSLPCNNSDCRKVVGGQRHQAYKSAPTRRAKKKVAKAPKNSSLCSVMALFLLGVFGSGIYGAVELVNWAIS